MRFKKLVSNGKIVSFLLAVYLFNFSIDSRDAHPDHVREDLSHNDIESILEFALESILGIENAIHEHDEKDNDHGRFSGQVVFIQQSPLASMVFRSHEGVPVEHHFGRHPAFEGQDCLDILSPPPKG